jgi:hypothetical protein
MKYIAGELLVGSKELVFGSSTEDWVRMKLNTYGIYYWLAVSDVGSENSFSIVGEVALAE